MSICKVHVPGDCAGNCEQPATGAPTRCRCGTVCGNPSCFEPATGATGYPFGHYRNEYSTKDQPGECVSYCPACAYEAGRRAALEEARLSTDIQDLMKGGEDNGLSI